MCHADVPRRDDQRPQATVDTSKFKGLANLGQGLFFIRGVHRSHAALLALQGLARQGVSTAAPQRSKGHIGLAALAQRHIVSVDTGLPNAVLHAPRQQLIEEGRAAGLSAGRVGRRGVARADVARGTSVVAPRGARTSRAREPRRGMWPPAPGKPRLARGRPRYAVTKISSPQRQPWLLLAFFYPSIASAQRAVGSGQ